MSESMTGSQAGGPVITGLTGNGVSNHSTDGDGSVFDDDRSRSLYTGTGLVSSVGSMAGGLSGAAESDSLIGRRFEGVIDGSFDHGSFVTIYTDTMTFRSVHQRVSPASCTPAPPLSNCKRFISIRF